jgi:hypothetical protein
MNRTKVQTETAPHHRRQILLANGKWQRWQMGKWADGQMAEFSNEGASQFLDRSDKAE